MRMSRLSPIAPELARAAAILGHQFFIFFTHSGSRSAEEKALLPSKSYSMDEYSNSL
jgi:glycerol-3-phosphate acyltransferase PlsY